MATYTNYNFYQAVTEYNQDPVRVQTMYQVEFTSGIDKIDETLKRMQIYAQNFTLPDRTVNFEDVQYRAYKIPVPTNMDMGQDHDVTVYADVRGDLRRACLDWQAACFNPDIVNGSLFQANRRPTQMGADSKEPMITLKLLAADMDSVVETTVIHGSRVTKVGGLELSNVASGVNTFSVSFKSVWWEQQAGSAGIGSKNGDNMRNANLGQPNEEEVGQALKDGSATNF